MILTIVSGLSGWGKSVALNTLEVLGYCWSDNLPVGLLAACAAEMTYSSASSPGLAAAGIDARNHPGDLERFPAILKTLRASNITCRILFLQSDDNTLLKRYSETRRKHPLSSADVSLTEAIQQERELLGPIAASADLFIDTSRTSIHQLRDLIKNRVAGEENPSFSLLIESFGYKHGVPGDADFVFDVRCLPNPHWEPGLRPLTGRDRDVIEYLENDNLVREMAGQIESFLNNWIPHFQTDNRSYLTIAIGCTGGQHRSVYMAERLARYFRPSYDQLVIRHRDLP